MSAHIPTLNKLKDQLSDLSMRNRSLRLVRLAAKRAFDLAALDGPGQTLSLNVLRGLLSGKNSSVRLLDVGGEDPEAARLHRGLTHLDRDVKLLEQERGIYDLSVGVGFLCGNIADGKYLQAPVFLLPRRLMLERRGRDGSRWSLAPIGDADTVDVNRTLLLALQKFTDVTIEPEELEEEAQKCLFGAARDGAWLDGLASSLAELLRSRHLTVISSSSGRAAVPPLTLLKSDEMPTTPTRRFEFRPHAVLGRFPLADTALLDDYERFIRTLEVNPRQPLGYAGALLGDAEASREVATAGRRTAMVSPRMHIEPTDESQEAVIAQAVGGQSLAVHGPPGTGKSQLIANLVASAAAEGKRVLVVSQKRPALDVVYQRLGADLSRFVALVHDPVRDRPLLCARILGAVDALQGESGLQDESARKRVLASIEEDERWFAAAHSAMTTVGSEGRAAVDVYADRLRRSGAPPSGVVRGLPLIAPEELELGLPDVDWYVEIRRLARPDGDWRASRPDWSDRTIDDLERVVEETLPDLGRAVTGVLDFVDQTPPGGPTLLDAAAANASWVQLKEFSEATAALSPAVHRLIAGVSENGAGSVGVGVASLPERWDGASADQLPVLQAAAGRLAAWRAVAQWAETAAAVDADVWAWIGVLAEIEGPQSVVAADCALMDSLMHARVAAGGRTLDLREVPQARSRVSAYEAATVSWARYLSPGWYAARRLAAGAVGVPAAGERQLPQLIVDWRRVVEHSEQLDAAPGRLRVLCALGMSPATVTAEELAAVRGAAERAADLVQAWTKLAAPASAITATLPPTDTAARALAARCRHGETAVGVLAGIRTAAEGARTRWDALAPAVTALSACTSFPTASENREVYARAAHAVRAQALRDKLDTLTATLVAWVGPGGKAWVGDAIKNRGPDGWEAAFGRTLSESFEAYAEADGHCRGFEARAPRLAKLAVEGMGWRVPSVAEAIGAAYAERAVRDLEGAQPVLRGITDEELGKRRTRLASGLSSLESANRRTLLARLAARAGQAGAETSPLHQRASQKRMRWPLRKLVENFWEKSLGPLLPIWLCSPETVAAAFPFRRNVFDLVIFDEASQLTLARGLTASYRGKVCIVAGDEQQLPPSNFFSASLEEDETGLDEVVEEESLLARAKVAAPQARLLWHYRSKYPELIQFSNDRFYSGALRVAPVPATHASPAVEWVGLPGSWSRGTSTNEIEANAAIDLLHRFLTDHPTLSVGIITLNRSQSDRIEELVVERAGKNAEFARLWDASSQRELDERPFIRNLENVQGDERDVTIVSVGYSADPVTGRVPLRFGALTVGGGDRRLNVAVSRARQKMLVLCSFDPETQMNVEDSASDGNKALHDFLVYARTGCGAARPVASGAIPHPAHEAVIADVCAALSERGWTTERAVGASSARVDIAVRSQRDASRFALGILLDGPGAAWAATTVGREIGRASYLGRYQWPIQVLGVRPWVVARAAVLERLVARLVEEDGRLAGVTGPPRVTMSATKPTVRVAPALGPIPARPPVRPSLTPIRPAAPPSSPVSRPAVGPVEDVSASKVGPGSTVRYRNAATQEVQERVLVGPTVPRGIDAVALNTPLAVALLGAEVGEVVEMQLQSRVVGLEVLEIKAAP